MTGDQPDLEVSRQTPQEITISAILNVIGEIVRTASDGSFVFRGEPKYYEQTSSSLYREYAAKLGPFGADGFDIRHVQDEIIEDAAFYTEDLAPQDLLSQLQHFGYPTNLIDFTTDYLVALYFACSSEPNDDGRVILLDAQANEPVRMRSPANRIKAQKSVFVNPPSGTVTGDKTIRIPRELKLPILGYLRIYHDISTQTIYDDIHGFIKNANVHRSAYTEFHIAGLYAKRGQFSEAIEHYSNSIAMNGDQTASYGMRGQLFLRIGNCGKAIEDFNRVIELDPQDAKAHKNRGMAYVLDDQPAFAEKDLTEAIRIDPESGDAYFGRAMARQLIHNSDGAIEDLYSAIELDPENAQAYNARGLAFWVNGDNRSALRDLDTAIALDQEYAIAYGNRARVYFKMREFQNAIDSFDTCIRLDGDTMADVYFQRGVAHVALENFDEARSDLKTSLELDPGAANKMFRSEGNLLDSIEFLEVKHEIPTDVFEMLRPS